MLTKKQAKEWIDKIKKANKEHWDTLDEKGYSREDDSDPYGFEIDGFYFEEWHESNDAGAIMTFLEHVFKL